MTGARKGVLYDACAGENVARELLGGHRRRNRVEDTRGRLERQRARVALDALMEGVALDSIAVTSVRGEQSNSSILFGDRLILKLFRRLASGPNPDLEIGLHLVETAGFTRVPAVAGALRYQRPGVEPTTVGSSISSSGTRPTAGTMPSSRSAATSNAPPPCPTRLRRRPR